MVVAEQQPVVSDATTYYPHGFSSSSQLLQLPPDAHTVLVNLDAFAALFVEYHSCVYVQSIISFSFRGCLQQTLCPAGNVSCRNGSLVLDLCACMCVCVCWRILGVDGEGWNA